MEKHTDEEIDEIINKHYSKHKVGQTKLYQIIKKAEPSFRVTQKRIADFFAKQKVEQRYKLPNKVKEYTHLIAECPNEIHQIDLVKMDKDRGYEHFIIIIDVFSRYAKGLPLKSKSAAVVSQAIASLYEDPNSHLCWPASTMVDQGKEFMGETKQLFNTHNVRVIMNISKDKHFTSIVERMNKTIETPLFKNQAEEELAEVTQSDIVRPVIKWKDNLVEYIDNYNNQPHSLLKSVITGDNLSPTEAMVHPEDVTYAYKMIEDDRPTYKVGTYVKLPFARDSRSVNRHMIETYSNKLYVIIYVKPATLFQPTKYYIADADTLDTLPMTYYRDELIAVPASSVSTANSSEGTRVTRLPTRRTTREIEDELYADNEVVSAEPVVTPLTTMNRRGRTINKPKRLEDYVVY